MDQSKKLQVVYSRSSFWEAQEIAGLNPNPSAESYGKLWHVIFALQWEMNKETLNPGRRVDNIPLGWKYSHSTKDAMSCWLSHRTFPNYRCSEVLRYMFCRRLNDHIQDAWIGLDPSCIKDTWSPKSFWSIQWISQEKDESWRTHHIGTDRYVSSWQNLKLPTQVAEQILSVLSTQKSTPLDAQILHSTCDLRLWTKRPLFSASFSITPEPKTSAFCCLFNPLVGMLQKWEFRWEWRVSVQGTWTMPTISTAWHGSERAIKFSSSSKHFLAFWFLSLVWSSEPTTFQTSSLAATCTSSAM